METFYSLEKVLLSLSPVECKQFEKFLQSPYLRNNHANNKLILKLFKLIRKNLDLKCKNQYFNWDDIFEKVVPDKSFICNNYLSKIKSDLLRYLLDFFAIDFFKKEKIFYKTMVLNELNNRNLIDIFRHYCTVDRFAELNVNKECTQYSFYLWRLVHTLNKHKEKKINQSASAINHLEGQIDYDVERHLLKKYFKQELMSLKSRQVGNGSKT